MSKDFTAICAAPFCKKYKVTLYQTLEKPHDFLEKRPTKQDKYTMDPGWSSLSQQK